MKSTRIIVALCTIFLAFPLASVSRGAATVWDGPMISFSKEAFADVGLALNQDRLTDNVWLTRGATQGLINLATESFYTHNSSPAGTEWAHGTTANYASLTYTDWETWAGGAPNIPNLVGQPAVVHLIADDIYLNLTFTAWGVGSGSGGSFSYNRSTAVPEPASLALLGLGGFLFSTRRRG